ncbi:metal ABC transporter solute-binding protein, Zn/Mn family [Oceanobacillus sp. J11TS1]|uniref:metal ABC transporter solute-binding protein, Zn/Mn family n=1 Tax=Oceanobacillus sp. J11TS1 TaxID=2807191 RepID=UPI001B1A3DDF|nr:zinc ABC transporter substrate-binding protein [Oceanobacillus sp. J11TS1]GIO23982.1 manganese transporter [Oceanobacillus sp. J11TS1]
MKRKWKNIMSIGICMGFFFLVACGSDNGEGSADEDDKITVVTTIAQIGEPLSVIGGEHVNVESLMGPSVDPHLYNPTQSDISKVDGADVIFYNGLNLEANMTEVFESISSEKPVLAIGETLPEDQLLKDEEGAIDPHIWFDYNMWQDALDAAVEELKDYAPDYADEFEANKQAYFAELDALKTEAEKLQDIPENQRVLVTAHDAFGYFGRLHNVEVVGLQGLSTESEIGVSDINKTIELIAEHDVPAIFVESSVNQDSINAVVEGSASNGVEIEIGGELYSDAMGEEGTEEGTYIGMYKYNVDTIYEALTEGDE